MFEFFKSIQTHMDFEGQAKAENISRIIVVLFGAVGFVWGLMIQQFSQTVYILGAGFVLAALLTVPPWPLYRKKPLKWLKSKVAVDDEAESEHKSHKKRSK